MLSAAQPEKEFFFTKLAKTPSALLFLIFSAIIFIESTTLLLLLSHSSLATQLREKVANSQTGQSIGWKLYQNKDLGLEFKYPPEMTKDTSLHPGVVDRFFLFEVPQSKSGGNLEGMLLNMEISPYQTPEDAASFIASFFQSDATQITTENTVIGSLVPAKIVHIEEKGSTSIAENMYVFVKLNSGNVLEIQVFWTGKGMEKYDKIANQILSTFELID